MYSNHFFITKITGKETGLGLPLSYSSIKARGGQLIVESSLSSGQGEIKKGAEFIIILPLDENSFE
jgi:signal transduction histidine kinase